MGEVEPKKDDDWMQKKWRPAMGWMYMIICVLDMAIFPIMWNLVQVMMKHPVTQWDPLTLKGAGLFHLAMGAVLGIAAWGRTQEKLGGAAAHNGVAAPSMSAPSAPSVSTPYPQPTTQYAPVQRTMAPSYSPAPRSPAYEDDLYAQPQGQVFVGYGGRAAPAPAPQPLI
jgi:hypothetical protein